jgi:hypothetical protein
VDGERIIATFGTHAALKGSNGADDANERPAFAFREVAPPAAFL